MRFKLRHEPFPIVLQLPACAALLVVIVALTSCERTPPSNGRDSGTVAPPTVADSGEPVTTNVGWNSDAGTVLLVASDVPGVGAVVFPEVTDSTFGDSALMDLARLCVGEVPECTLAVSRMRSSRLSLPAKLCCSMDVRCSRECAEVGDGVANLECDLAWPAPPAAPPAAPAAPGVAALPARAC